MSKSEELAAALQRNFDGQPWHGSSLLRIVGNVAPERAFTRPAPEIRSIAELLAHTIAWVEIVTERLRGASPEVTPERDFPSVDGVPWDTLVARLHTAFAALLDAVRAIGDDAAWQRNAPGKTHTMAHMVDGLLHHTTYHAAQMALLNRM
ncbi:MAG TPA: DinB family protein [Thermoanaerobaculia bacterium]|nr:DinB family protein [Thermoanaerobaculia bacterium]